MRIALSQSTQLMYIFVAVYSVHLCHCLEGTRFVLGFLENFMTDHYPVARIYISTAFSGITNVVISVPRMRDNNAWWITQDYEDVYVNVTVGQSYMHEFPYDLHMFGNGIEDKGILVSSDRNITVHAQSVGPTASDAYLVLPVAVLGKQYFVVSHVFQPLEAITGSPSSMAVIATERLSAVEIQLTSNHIHVSYSGYGAVKQGKKITMILDVYQTYQLQSEDDLSGTKVVSSDNIVVLAGCMWTQPTIDQSGDFFIEMLPPIHYWGYEYFTSTLSSAGGDFFKVVAMDDKTKIEIIALSEVPWIGNAELQSGEFYQFEIPSGLNVFVRATHPVMMAQFSQVKKVDEEDGFGSPVTHSNRKYIMAMVPPFSHWSDHYNVASLYAYDTSYPSNNLILIITQASYIPYMKINNRSITSEEYHTGWKNIPRTTYSCMILLVQTDESFEIGNHYGAKFYAMYYGGTNVISGGFGEENYAFPLGLLPSPQKYFPPISPTMSTSTLPYVITTVPYDISTAQIPGFERVDGSNGLLEIITGPTHKFSTISTQRTVIDVGDLTTSSQSRGVGSSSNGVTSQPSHITNSLGSTDANIEQPSTLSHLDGSTTLGIEHSTFHTNSGNTNTSPYSSTHINQFSHSESVSDAVTLSTAPDNSNIQSLTTHVDEYTVPLNQTKFTTSNIGEIGVVDNSVEEGGVSTISITPNYQDDIGTSSRNENIMSSSFSFSTITDENGENVISTSGLTSIKDVMSTSDSIQNTNPFTLSTKYDSSNELSTNPVVGTSQMETTYGSTFVTDIHGNGNLINITNTFAQSTLPGGVTTTVVGQNDDIGSGYIEDSFISSVNPSEGYPGSQVNSGTLTSPNVPLQNDQTDTTQHSTSPYITPALPVEKKDDTNDWSTSAVFSSTSFVGGSGDLLDSSHTTIWSLSGDEDLIIGDGGDGGGFTTLSHTSTANQDFTTSKSGEATTSVNGNNLASPTTTSISLDTTTAFSSIGTSSQDIIVRLTSRVAGDIIMDTTEALSSLSTHEVNGDVYTTSKDGQTVGVSTRTDNTNMSPVTKNIINKPTSTILAGNNDASIGISETTTDMSNNDAGKLSSPGNPNPELSTTPTVSHFTSPSSLGVLNTSSDFLTGSHTTTMDPYQATTVLTEQIETSTIFHNVSNLAATGEEEETFIQKYLTMVLFLTIPIGVVLVCILCCILSSCCGSIRQLKKKISRKSKLSGIPVLPASKYGSTTDLITDKNTPDNMVYVDPMVLKHYYKSAYKAIYGTASLLDVTNYDYKLDFNDSGCGMSSAGLTSNTSPSRSNYDLNFDNLNVSHANSTYSKLSNNKFKHFITSSSSKNMTGGSRPTSAYTNHTKSVSQIPIHHISNVKIHDHQQRRNSHLDDSSPSELTKNHTDSSIFYTNELDVPGQTNVDKDIKNTIKPRVSSAKSLRSVSSRSTVHPLDFNDGRLLSKPPLPNVNTVRENKKFRGNILRSADRYRRRKSSTVSLSPLTNPPVGDHQSNDVLSTYSSRRSSNIFIPAKNSRSNSLVLPSAGSEQSSIKSEKGDSVPRETTSITTITDKCDKSQTLYPVNVVDSQFKNEVNIFIPNSNTVVPSNLPDFDPLKFNLSPNGGEKKKISSGTHQGNTVPRQKTRMEKARRYFNGN